MLISKFCYYASNLRYNDAFLPGLEVLYKKLLKEGLQKEDGFDISLAIMKFQDMKKRVAQEFDSEHSKDIHKYSEELSIIFKDVDWLQSTSTKLEQIGSEAYEAFNAALMELYQKAENNKSLVITMENRYALGKQRMLELFKGVNELLVITGYNYQNDKNIVEIFTKIEKITTDINLVPDVVSYDVLNKCALLFSHTEQYLEHIKLFDGTSKVQHQIKYNALYANFINTVKSKNVQYTVRDCYMETTDFVQTSIETMKEYKVVMNHLKGIVVHHTIPEIAEQIKGYKTVLYEIFTPMHKKSLNLQVFAKVLYDVQNYKYYAERLASNHNFKLEQISKVDGSVRCIELTQQDMSYCTAIIMNNMKNTDTRVVDEIKKNVFGVTNKTQQMIEVLSKIIKTISNECIDMIEVNWTNVFLPKMNCVEDSIISMSIMIQRMLDKANTTYSIFIKHSPGNNMPTEQLNTMQGCLDTSCRSISDQYIIIVQDVSVVINTILNTLKPVEAIKIMDLQFIYSRCDKIKNIALQETSAICNALSKTYSVLPENIADIQKLQEHQRGLEYIISSLKEHNENESVDQLTNDMHHELQIVEHTNIFEEYDGMRSVY